MIPLCPFTNDPSRRITMTRLIFTLLIALFICASYHQISHAVCIGPIEDVISCIDDPPNPDPDGVQQNANPNNLGVNVLENAGIDTFSGNGLDCILTGDGNDNIAIIEATLDCQQDAVNPWDGTNTINITNSTLTSRSDVIDAFNGTNTINVQGSSLICAGMNLGCDGMNLSGGDDEVTVTQSIISGLGFSFRLGSGDDTLRLGTGADIRGVIECDFGINPGDSLIFAMEVPESQLVSLSAEIALLAPNDSIVINGLFYEWEDCANIVNELSTIAPIPTLSEWGLIAMAGLLGIVGFMVMRRRKVTA